MIEALLGPVIDIHGGGADLVFPHHENEMAQSAVRLAARRRRAAAAAAHATLAGSLQLQAGGGGDGRGAAVLCALVDAQWVCEHRLREDVQVRPSAARGAAVMYLSLPLTLSRSLGNFFTIREVLQRYSPVALRLLLLGTHYRAAISYSSRALDEASDRAYYVYATLAEADAAAAAAGDDGAPPPTSGPAAEARAAAAALPAACASALADDVNTPAALAALSAPLKAVNDLLTTKAGRRAPGRAAALRDLACALRAALEPLGLADGGDPGRELDALRASALVRAGLSESELAERLAARDAARRAGDYAASDSVRLDLSARGIGLMDGGAAGGIAWRPVSAAPPGEAS